MDTPDYDPIRDTAVTFSATTQLGQEVKGTMWFRLKGKITKEVIAKVGEDFCKRALEQGAKLEMHDLVLLNVFITEA